MTCSDMLPLDFSLLTYPKVFPTDNKITWYANESKYVLHFFSLYKPFKQNHIHTRALLFAVSDPPPSLSILPIDLCTATVTVADDVTERVPQELPSLRGGPRMVDGYHTSPCQPLFITFWLELPHKHIHGNLHHVFTA